MQTLLHIENIDHLYFSDLLLPSCFFIQLRDSIYDPTRLKFALWHLWYNSSTESKTKLLPFIDVSKPSWYLERSDSKNFCGNSVYISHCFHVITFWMHYSLFIPIFRGNKVNCDCWIFHVPDFWWSVIISFR